MISQSAHPNGRKGQADLIRAHVLRRVRYGSQRGNSAVDAELPVNQGRLTTFPSMTGRRMCICRADDLMDRPLPDDSSLLCRRAQPSRL